MIVGIDLDDTLAASLDSFIEFHNEEYGTKLKFEDFKAYTLNEIIGLPREEEANRLDLFDKSKFFDKIKPIKGSQKAIRSLIKSNRLVIITARVKSMEKKTRDWLAKYFPELKEIVFISEDYKGYIKTKVEVCKEIGAEVMIDDKASFALECASEGIKVLLLDYPWNTNVKDGPLIVRVDSWEEILEKLS
jgi:5'(3')-deoxyribonucleotidase